MTATRPDRRTRVLRNAGTLFLAAALAFLFQRPVLELAGYGATWDERIEFRSLHEQIDLARQVLDGRAEGFEAAERIRSKGEYYGIVNKLPGLVAWRTVQWARGHPVLGWEWDRDAVTGFHLWTLACLVVLLWTTLALARELVGRTWIAWAAPLLLVLTPRFVGHTFFNFKDVPFATFYGLATLAMLRAWTATTPREVAARTILAWLACGMVAATKLPAIAICWPMIAVAASMPWWPEKPRDHVRRMLLWAATPVAVILFTTATMPAAWVGPWTWLEGAFRLFTNYPWGGCTMVWGACIPAVEVGRMFLPTWLLLTTPLLLIALSIYAVILGVRAAKREFERQRFSVLSPESGMLAGLAVGAQLLTLPVLAIAARSPLYDGERHFLFMMPAACAASAAAIDHFRRTVQTPWLRAGGLAAAAALSMLVAVDVWRLHPYEYTYYNEVGRFLSPAESFETDYWGYSLGELARRQLASPAPDHSAETPLTGFPSLTLAPFWPERLAPFTIRVRNGRAESDGMNAPIRVLALHRFDWRGVPRSCTEIDRIERRLTFAPHAMPMGRTMLCAPDTAGS